MDETSVSTSDIQFLRVCSLVFIFILAGCERDLPCLMSSSRNDVELVKGELEERYKCIACRLVLQSPMQSSCGHR